MSVKQISIPKPCLQPWQQMAVVNNGRYCDHCCKTVIDFTVMSDAEVIRYFSATEHVCGRFGQQQLVDINKGLAANKRGRFSWVSLLVASIVSFTSFERAEAKAIHGIEQGPSLRENKRALPDTTVRVFVQGFVFEKSTGQPLVGTSVHAKTGEQAAVDLSGRFKLTVPASAETLVFSFVGFKSQEIKIADIVNNASFKIEMEEIQADPNAAIVVVGGAWGRSSFTHRLWHKIKNLF